MVDPVSIGAAAVVLLATKYGEGVAQSAAAGTLPVLGRLRERVAARFRDEPDTTAAVARLDTESSHADRAVVAARIDEVAAADPGFRAEVQQLLSVARHDSVVGAHIAQAFDQAKQVNIHGDHHGDIHL
ncbi:hypothetical protein [Nocardia cyriacigeorgica]|uniref:hypothetical protein n=1 Tax=Nocardia cyriacigeorgica TaxID=135487 RepID=UPI0024577614|nr:hypothetical protein [Nocardia cyriacigeorgica]